jgi:hypothetical protein
MQIHHVLAYVLLHPVVTVDVSTEGIVAAPLPDTRQWQVPGACQLLHSTAPLVAACLSPCKCQPCEAKEQAVRVAFTEAELYATNFDPQWLHGAAGMASQQLRLHLLLLPPASWTCALCMTPNANQP